MATHGVVIHSTRGNAATPTDEFVGTINWFRNPSSEVSAHIVISPLGVIARVVRDELQAWHAGENNARWLGVELCQRYLGEPITKEQVRSLAWWVREVAARYGFVPGDLTLPYHSELPQGVRIGKTDAFERWSADGAAFRKRLLREIGS